VKQSAAADQLHSDTIQRKPDRPAVGVNAPGSSKRLLVYGAIVLVAALVGIWYLLRPSGQQDDSKIVSEITNKIDGDGRVTDKNINIKFAQGVVELSGKVSSDLARNAAGDGGQQPADRVWAKNRWRATQHTYYRANASTSSANSSHSQGCRACGSSLDHEREQRYVSEPRWRK
jgi:hypothetical protein